MKIDGIQATYSVPFHLHALNGQEGTAQRTPHSTGREPSQATSSVLSLSDSYTKTNTEDPRQSQNAYLVELSEEERKNLEELRARDQEVRAHEQAHTTAGGALAGPPQYEFETGPDGRQYVVSGGVDIDTSEGRTPEETIQRAQVIRRSALAPANPSAADRQVAMEAAQMEAEARAELAEKNKEILEQSVLGQTSGEDASRNEHAPSLIKTPNPYEAYQVSRPEDLRPSRQNTLDFYG